MGKASTKDFLIAGVCCFAASLVFFPIYFSEDRSFSSSEGKMQEEIFTYVPVPEQSDCFSCPEIFIDERDGKEYPVFQVGHQCWMAENLNYKLEGASCYESRDLYGCYYGWELALEACPIGWRLPSDNDWKTLEIQLGMNPEEAHKSNVYRYTFVENGEVGGMLKSHNLWSEPNECYGECGVSGFNILPAGSRGENSALNLGDEASFWTSTEAEGYGFTGVFTRKVYYADAGIARERRARTEGYSVRCLME